MNHRMAHSLFIVLVLFSLSSVIVCELYDNGPHDEPYPGLPIMNGKLINMTGYHQHEEYTCGDASIRMIVGYYFNSTPSETEIKEQCDTRVECMKE